MLTTTKISRKLKKTKGPQDTGCFIPLGCLGIGFLLALIPLAICSYLFQYCIRVMFDKDLPWLVDVMGGALCNAFIIVAAFICWVATLLGYQTPLFP